MLNRLIHVLKLLPFRLLLAFIEFKDRPKRLLKSSNLPVKKQSERWEKAAPLPSWRYEFASGLLNDEIYVIGGVLLPSVWFPTHLVEIYNIRTDSWRKGVPYPKLVHHTGIATVRGQLYVVGGNGIRIIPRSDVYAFNPTSQSWTRCADLPTARGALGVAVLNDIIYAVGGGINKKPVPILEAYDPKKNTWMTCSRMPTAREHLIAVSCAGKIFALGGYSQNRFNNLTANEAYDPTTNTWTQLAPLPYPVSGLSAASIGDSIFIFGGEQGWAVSGEVHQYLIQEDRWVRRSNLPYARYALTATSNGKAIHVIGGNGVLMGYDFRNDHDVFLS